MGGGLESAGREKDGVWFNWSGGGGISVGGGSKGAFATDKLRCVKPSFIFFWGGGRGTQKPK